MLRLTSRMQMPRDVRDVESTSFAIICTAYHDGYAYCYVLDEIGVIPGRTTAGIVSPGCTPKRKVP